MNEDWYLIKKYEEYDKSDIELEKFITQDPDKYTSIRDLPNHGYYKAEKIEVK